jgi:N-acetyl-anhydromuramyl-L-alanine amidase AmpD
MDLKTELKNISEKLVDIITYISKPVNDLIFDESLKMKTQGKYPNNYPSGLVIHFTAGRSLNGDKDAENTVKYGQSQGYAYWCMSSTGKIYKTHDIDSWGYHAGSSSWKNYGSVSDNFLGLEICNAGRLTKIDDNNYKSWFSEVYTKDQVRYSDKVVVPGLYHKYTEAQEEALTKLCIWLYKNNPDVFQIDNIVGHDECATPLGRKNDPGGSLSFETMQQYRTYLKGLI